MNKAQHVERIAQLSGFTKVDANRAVDAFSEAVEEALLKGDKVMLMGLGTFSVSEQRPRPGRNPRTGEAATVPPHKRILFKPGIPLKKKLNPHY